MCRKREGVVTCSVRVRMMRADSDRQAADLVTQMLAAAHSGIGRI
jgi:hypothetical protein